MNFTLRMVVGDNFLFKCFYKTIILLFFAKDNFTICLAVSGAKSLIDC